MAKFWPGPLVSEIRNALGSQVFSRNQWGAFVRARVNPDQTLTADRETARLAMTDASNAWRNTLTDQQRDAWHRFADAMHVHAHSPIFTTINGPALFIKLWILAYWWSGNFLTDPPNDLDTPFLQSIDLTNDAENFSLDLAFSPSPVPAGQLLMVYATQPLNPGVTRPKKWFKPITLFAAGTTSPQNIWTPYESAFYQPGSGLKIFTRCSLAHEYNNLPTVPLQSVTLLTGDDFPMLRKVVTVTDAQIKSLPTTPVLLIPAIAGKQIVPFRAALQLNANAGAYTNISAGPANYIGFTSGAQSLNRTQASLFLTPAQITTSIPAPRATLDAIPPTVTDPNATLATQPQWLTSDLNLTAVNAAGAYTGGNAANSLTVTVWYQLLDTI